MVKGVSLHFQIEKKACPFHPHPLPVLVRTGMSTVGQVRVVRTLRVRLVSDVIVNCTFKLK